MRRVIASPAFVEVVTSDDTYQWIVEMAEFTDEFEHRGGSVIWGDGWQARVRDLDSVEENTPGRLVGRMMPGQHKITVRYVEPGDVVGVAGWPGYPLPLEVIKAQIAGENMDTHIEALVEDDGFVATLLLVTDVGMWVRFSGAWHRLTNLTPIEGLNTHVVTENAVALYDAADQAGAQMPISSMPLEDGEMVAPRVVPLGSIADAYVASNASRTFRTADEVAAAEAARRGVTAAGPETLPVVETREELLAAAKTATPNARWYLLKRALALGVAEDELTWPDDEEEEDMTIPDEEDKEK